MSVTLYPATSREQQFCCESQIWWALDDDEKLPFTRNLIRQSYENLRAGLYNMIYGQLLPDEDLIPICEKMIALDESIRGEDATHPRHYLAQFYCMFAQIYARLGRTKEALEQLEIAAGYAAAFDNRPVKGNAYSLLLGEITWKQIDFETDDTRKCQEIMLNKWLAHPDFDAIRNTAAFQQIAQTIVL